MPPAAAVADASEGREAAELTPLHRSAVAVRVEAAGAVFAAGAVLLAVERAEPLLVDAVLLDAFGAAELAKTGWPFCLVTPAVDPLTRDVTALWRAGAGFVTARLDSRTAPLVEADALCAGAETAGALACAGA